MVAKQVEQDRLETQCTTPPQQHTTTHLQQRRARLRREAVTRHIVVLECVMNPKVKCWHVALRHRAITVDDKTGPTGALLTGVEEEGQLGYLGCVGVAGGSVAGAGQYACMVRLYAVQNIRVGVCTARLCVMVWLTMIPFRYGCRGGACCS